jgi:SAM-dependent methyltransferase
MRDFVASMYGEAIADVYDNGSLLAHADGGARAGETGAAVAFLSERAGTGRVLELGVGTGRIAIALAAGGIEVHGIDVSQAMADRLRAKPGGDAVTVHIGDMADVDVAGPFTLVYVVANTLFCLTSQDQQVRCVRNVAACLGQAGRLVVEAFVPDPSRFDRGQRVEVRESPRTGCTSMSPGTTGPRRPCPLSRWS